MCLCIDICVYAYIPIKNINANKLSRDTMHRYAVSHKERNA